MRIAWKSYILALFIVSTLLLTLTPITTYSGETIATGFTIEYKVPSPNIEITGNYTRVSIEGYVYDNTPGKPVVPVKRLFILVPPATIDLRVDVYVVDKKLIPLENLPQPSKPICVFNVCYTRGVIYRGIYPSKPYVVEDEQWLGPYRYIPVVIYPIQYDFYTNNIVYNAKYTIHVSYKLLPPKNVPRIATEFNQRLMEAITYNRWVLDYFYNHVKYIPDNDPGGYRYVVVTTTSLKDYFRPLLEWKKAKGYSIGIFTTDYINQTYTGRNLQEKIRNFAIDMYNNYGLEYLVLGGDYDQVPPLWYYGPSDYDPEPEWNTTDNRYKATDLFYALLNGDNTQWDPDHDGLYLEYTSGTDPNGTVDEPLPDKLPDIVVGRISASTATELNDVINKILRYEKNITVGPWIKKAILAGAIANYENEDYNNVPKTDEAYVMELIKDDFLTPKGYSYVRLYEKAGLDPSTYPCEYSLTKENFSLVYNSGAGVVFESGHGWPTGHYRKIWAWDDGDGIPESGEMDWYTFFDTDTTISNGVYNPVSYLSACLTGMFDYSSESLAEYLLERSDGSIAIVASARTSFYVPGWRLGDGGNHELLYYFAKALIYDEIDSIASALYTSKVYYVNAGFNMDQWWNMKNFLNYNFFGDPETGLWRNPRALNVSHPSVVSIPGSGNVSVDVVIKVKYADTDDPVANASVTLWLRNGSIEVYLVNTTNSSGIALFHLSGNVSGAYNVTVSGRDLIPYTGVLYAEPLPQPIPEPLNIWFAALTVLASVAGIVLFRRFRRR